MIFNSQTKGIQAAVVEPDDVSYGSMTPTLSTSSVVVEGSRNEEDGQKRLDKLLVRELNQLSIPERERVYEEIHGVNQVAEETPGFVEQRLEQLDRIVHSIHHKPAYDQAMAQNPAYCRNPKLRLAFLRAEYFDANAAAARMVAFFEGKLEYFGPDALARDLQLETDMDADDRRCLQGGHLQFLSMRDRAGRAVFCDFQAAFPRVYKNARNMVKTFIYMMMCAAEDEVNQKLGIVGLLYHVGDQLNKPDPDLMKRGPATVKWVPIRFNSLHICVNHTMSSILARLLLLGAGKQLRTRSRVHHGTHTECQYGLLSFGVPVQIFPLSAEGELKLAECIKWVRRRKVKDDTVRRKGIFHGYDLPTNTDVLMGKGKPFQMHPGNVHLRYICETRLDEYKSSRKGNKSELAIQVMNSVGKFLKKESDGWWYEVDQEMAKDKVIKAFLSARATEPCASPVVHHEHQYAVDHSVNHSSTPQIVAEPTSISIFEQGSKRLKRGQM